MATRCGYYTDGFNLRRIVLDIDWNLGFDREAKLSYIKDMKEKLSSHFVSIEDVTTASPNNMSKSLSPHCMYTTDGKPLSDLYNDYGVPGVFDFLYMNTLTTEQVIYIMSIDCFIDVFHDPSKGAETQAKTLALFKMLCLQGKQHLLNNIDAFINWYNEYSMVYSEHI